MINQRAYPDVLLGYSTSLTFAGYGCYSACLLQGLLERGYSYTVRQWNDLLKSSGVYTTTNPTLIASTTVQAKLPNIFLEGRNEAWSDAKIIAYMNDPAYLIIGEVDARGIGGSGQHFVKIDHLDVSNGQVTMTYVDDPWDGLENRKVTDRYNTYGNIKSLRVFKIKNATSGGNMANMYPDTAPNIDLSNVASVKVAVDEWRKSVTGELVPKMFKEQRNLLFAKLGLKESDKIEDALSKLNEYASRPTKEDQQKAVDAATKAAQESCATQLVEYGNGLREDFEVEKKAAIKKAVADAKKEWEAEQPDPQPELPLPVPGKKTTLADVWATFMKFARGE